MCTSSNFSIKVYWHSWPSICYHSVWLYTWNIFRKMHRALTLPVCEWPRGQSFFEMDFSGNVTCRILLENYFSDVAVSYFQKFPKVTVHNGYCYSLVVTTNMHKVLKLHTYCINSYVSWKVVVLLQNYTRSYRYSLMELLVTSLKCNHTFFFIVQTVCTQSSLLDWHIALIVLGAVFLVVSIVLTIILTVMAAFRGKFHQ